MSELPPWPRYRPIRIIGQGGFGTVYLCEDTEPTSLLYQQEVAVKAVSLSALSDEEVLMVMSEVSLLKNIDHPNIIKYYDSFLYEEEEDRVEEAVDTNAAGRPSSYWSQSSPLAPSSSRPTTITTTITSQWLCIVTEYMDGGDLSSLLRQYAMEAAPHRSGSGLTTAATEPAAPSSSAAVLSPSPLLPEGQFSEDIFLWDTDDESEPQQSPSSTKRVPSRQSAGSPHKRPRSVDAALPSQDGTIKRDGDDNWMERSRQHRQRLASTLRLAQGPPPAASSASFPSATAATRLDGLDGTAENTQFYSWLSDASAADMPSTPLGATDVAAARLSVTDKNSSRPGGRKSPSPFASSSATQTAPPASPPPRPGQLWVESFLITDIAKQCLDALAYLHALSVVHRDIKPSNIYFSKRDGTVKLGDFGVSKLLQPSAPFTTTFVGTPFYLCPELCMGDPYSFGADIWALGVLLYELYCLKLPFTADNVLAQIFVITEGTYDTAALRTPHAFADAQLAVLEKLYGAAFLQSESLLHGLLVDMVEQMLQADPARRPSAEALLARVFGSGATPSRGGSSAGTSIMPSPVHRPPSAGVMAAAAAAKSATGGTDSIGSGRLGPQATDQHAQWASSLVQAASVAREQQQQPSNEIVDSLWLSDTPSRDTATDNGGRTPYDITDSTSEPLAVKVRLNINDILQEMPPEQRERLESRAGDEEAYDAQRLRDLAVAVPAAASGNTGRASSSHGLAAAAAAVSSQQPDILPLASINEASLDSLDRPIGTYTRQELDTLLEEVPWLQNAEVFSAIPLMAGSDDVMLVARGSHNSAGGDTPGEAEQVLSAAASVGSHASPMAPPPVRYAGTVSRTNPNIEIVPVISGTQHHQRHETQERTGAADEAPPQQRRVSGKSHSEANTAEAEAVHFTVTTTTTPRRQRVSVTSVHAMPITSHVTSPRVHLGDDESGYAENDTPAAVTIASGRGGGSGMLRNGSATGIGSGARLRPVSSGAFAAAAAESMAETQANGSKVNVAPLSATAASSASAAASTGATPKARSPGRCEGFSTDELEELLRAKLLAHYVKRQQERRVRRAQQVAEEAVKEEARERLQAIFAAAFGNISHHGNGRLSVASPDTLHDTDTYHSTHTFDTSTNADEDTMMDVHGGRESAQTVSHDDLSVSDSTTVLARQSTLPPPPSLAARRPPSAPAFREARMSTASPILAGPAALQALEEGKVIRGMMASRQARNTPQAGNAKPAAAPPRPPAAAAATGKRIAEVAEMDVLAATPAARQVRAAAELAAAVAKQKEALRMRKTPPARVHIAPTWRPPRYSKDVPGLWETSSADEEADDAARGRLGRPAPADAREEQRWRWSAPPSDLDEDDDEEDEEEEGSDGGDEEVTATSSNTSPTPSSRAGSSRGSSRKNSSMRRHAPRKARAASMEESEKSSSKTSRDVASANSLAEYNEDSGEGRREEEGVGQQSSLLGTPLEVGLEEATPHASSGSPSRVSSTSTHEKEENRSCSTTPSSNRQRGGRAGLRSPASSNKTGNSHSSRSGSSSSSSSDSQSEGTSRLSGPRQLQRHRVRLTTQHGGRHRALNRQLSESANSSSAHSPSSVSRTASFSAHATRSGRSGSSSSTGSSSRGRRRRRPHRRGNRRSSESDDEEDEEEDEDKPYAYTVLIDNETGCRFFDYVCPVTVELVGALPAEWRLMSATAALRELTTATISLESVNSRTAASPPSSLPAFTKEGQLSGVEEAPSAAAAAAAIPNPPAAPHRALTASAPAAAASPSDAKSRDAAAQLHASDDGSLGNSKTSSVFDEYFLLWPEATAQLLSDDDERSGTQKKPSKTAAGPSAAVDAVGETPKQRQKASGMSAKTTAAAAQSLEEEKVGSIVRPTHSAPASSAALQRTSSNPSDASLPKRHISSSGSALDTMKRDSTKGMKVADLHETDPDEGGEAPVPRRRVESLFVVGTSPLTASRTSPTPSFPDHKPGAESLTPFHVTGVSAPANGMGVVAFAAREAVGDDAESNGSRSISSGDPLSMRQRGGQPDADGRAAPRLSRSNTLDGGDAAGINLDGMWHIRVPPTPPLPASSPDKKRKAEVKLVSNTQFIHLPLSLALRPIRTRTRFVGLLWRLWMSVQLADPALRRVLLGADRCKGREAACAFRTAFGDWVTAQQRDRGDRDDSETTLKEKSLTQQFQSATTLPAAASAKKSGLVPHHWTLYYVDTRTSAAVELHNDADWAVVRHRVSEMGSFLPFIRLYLLLHDAEMAVLA